MRIESPARMEKRTSDPSRPPRQSLPSHSRKTKRRSGRKSNVLDTVLDTWPNSSQNDQDTSLMPGMEYPPRMLWQSTGVPQNVPDNGQRLFAAMSDPSVCGYSPLPLTYTMQPFSLPTMYRMYQPMPMPNVRTVHNRHRRHCNEHLTNVCPNANNNIVNGYGSLRENGRKSVHIAHQNGDYASLPPTANKDNGINGDELNSEHRRYSDPGLGPAENSPHSDSDDSDSIGSGSSVTTISRSNKLVLSLIEQMTELKKQNSQLFKELNETKSNLEGIKVKLVQCKHSTPTDYQPGMLSELICEIREANKNCEESLVTKVKSILEERCNQQANEIEEFKSQLAKLIKEKEESDQRVAKLEEEVMALKLSSTNEGREIAAFEEETLALRRELQEARASRTLAENHVAKCVNFAVSRSVTPVTFNTPCITSTPVRTALTDTCSLPSVPPSTISSHTSPVPFASRSRFAEVAAFLFVPEAQNSGTDSGSVSLEDHLWPTEDENDRCSETTLASSPILVTSASNDATNAVEIGPRNGMEKQRSTSTDTKTLCEILSAIKLDDLLISADQEEACDADTIKNDDIVKSTVIKEEIETKHSMTGIPDGQTGDNQLPRKCAKTATTEKAEAKILMSPSALEQKDLSNKRTSDVTTKIERLINHAGWRRLWEFHNQRGSFKRSRRKKCNLKRSFSETDKPDNQLSRQDTKLAIDTTPPCPSSGTSSDTVSEDEGCCPSDDHTSRAITEVPDVAVIGGGSIVPKDLCSTRTLTSRTQTAPSRATYTTAYI